MMNEKELLAFLDKNNFVYKYMEHSAVFTSAESEMHRPDIPAVSTKNLFCTIKKRVDFFLVVTACENTVKLEALALQRPML